MRDKKTKSSPPPQRKIPRGGGVGIHREEALNKDVKFSEPPREIHKGLDKFPIFKCMT